jgi:hypothetical protein
MTLFTRGNVRRLHANVIKFSLYFSNDLSCDTEVDIIDNFIFIINHFYIITHRAHEGLFERCITASSYEGGGIFGNEFGKGDDMLGDESGKGDDTLEDDSILTRPTAYKNGRFILIIKMVDSF